MKELIERLEQAEAGSRELDAEIAVAIDPVRWTSIYSALVEGCPFFSLSLDAARRLLPEGWDWLLDGVGLATLFNPGGTSSVEGRAATPELAFVVACLRARTEGRAG